MNDGRVEDGEILTCQVCGVTTHLYAEDNLICPDCQAGGWDWTQASYIRQGDVIKIGGAQIDVTGEESFGLRRAIYGSEARCWMRRQTSPVLVRR
jgi:hypothetical protein